MGIHMKIISWNCNGKFREKFEAITEEDIKLEKLITVNDKFKNFIYLNVNDSFNLLGVWAMQPYVEIIHDYFDDNSELFHKNLIMCGDFNSNVIWDEQHKTKDDEGNDKNHTNLNNKLNEKGLYSVYHELNNEELGHETSATFFQARHLNQPYHIDYLYAAKDKIYNFEILDHWKWISLSDHLPLSFELD